MGRLYYNNSFFKLGKRVLLPVTLACTLILPGCKTIERKNAPSYSNVSQESYFNNSEQNSSYIDYSNTSSETEKTVPMKDIFFGDKECTMVSFNEESLLEFNNFLDNTNIYYDYENLYNIEAALNEYNKLVFNDKHSHSIDITNPNELLNVILKNNEEYKKNEVMSLYKDLSNEELLSLCKLIVKTVNDFLNDNPDISKERISCVLSDLKVFNTSFTMSIAYVTGDNIMALSPNMLNFVELLDTEKTDSIIHEIVHLLQKGCNCDYEKNSNLSHNYGFSYNFKNLKINSLDYSWLYEASAEKNMSNYTGHNPLTYQYKIGYLESLSLVNLLNDNFKVNDTERLTFKKNLDCLFESFNVKTDKEKNEVLKLMYSIEVMQMEPKEFYEALEKITGKTPDDESYLEDVCFRLKASVCGTLTKFFYRNLANSISNKNLTLQDVFYLISLFENDINSHIHYDLKERMEYNEVFMDNYISIQNTFFHYLAKSLNIDQSSVEELFNNYTSKIKDSNGNVTDNYDLSFLSEEKREYLKSRETSLNENATESIRSAETLEKEKVK